MSTRKKILIPVVALVFLYLAVATLVILRSVWLVPPGLATETYLEALKTRDLSTIYLYSDMLGPRLTSLMEDSDLSDDAKRHNLAKDFARWTTEFERGTRAQDSLRRERTLLRPGAQVVKANPEEYKAEVQTGPNAFNLESYVDTPGQTYHTYYQVIFTSRGQAPAVDILDNIRTGGDRRIKSVVIRLETKRRPGTGFIRSMLMDWTWLDRIAFLVPFAGWFGQVEPSETWMVGVRFAVDKSTLETF